MFKKRPYGSINMGTTDWLALPITEVDIRILVPTQNQLTWSQFRNALLPEPHMDPCPYVVKWRGTRYIEDGHHRVLVRALTGWRSIGCRVLDLDEEEEDG